MDKAMTNSMVPTVEGQVILEYLEKPLLEDEDMYHRQAASYFKMVARLIESGSIDAAKVEWKGDGEILSRPFSYTALQTSLR